MNYLKKISFLIPATVYDITIITGQEFQSSTEANVLLTIHGEKSSISAIPVSPSGSSFMYGIIEKFQHQAFDIGQVRGFDFMVTC